MKRFFKCENGRLFPIDEVCLVRPIPIGEKESSRRSWEKASLWRRYRWVDYDSYHVTLRGGNRGIRISQTDYEHLLIELAGNGYLMKRFFKCEDGELFSIDEMRWVSPGDYGSSDSYWVALRGVKDVIRISQTDYERLMTGLADNGYLMNMGTRRVEEDCRRREEEDAEEDGEEADRKRDKEEAERRRAEEEEDRRWEEAEEDRRLEEDRRREEEEEDRRREEEEDRRREEEEEERRREEEEDRRREEEEEDEDRRREEEEEDYQRHLEFMGWDD